MPELYLPRGEGEVGTGAPGPPSPSFPPLQHLQGHSHTGLWRGRTWPRSRVPLPRGASSPRQGPACWRWAPLTSLLQVAPGRLAWPGLSGQSLGKWSRGLWLRGKGREGGLEPEKGLWGPMHLLRGSPPSRTRPGPAPHMRLLPLTTDAAGRT